MKNEFFCIECQKWHKMEAYHSGKNGVKACSFCIAKQIEIKAKRARTPTKPYKPNKLPPWMFS